MWNWRGGIARSAVAGTLTSNNGSTGHVALSVLLVRDGKGRRDRRVPLPGRLGAAGYLDVRPELARAAKRRSS
jgi:hypothetical protein